MVLWGLQKTYQHIKATLGRGKEKRKREGRRKKKEGRETETEQKDLLKNIKSILFLG